MKVFNKLSAMFRFLSKVRGVPDKIAETVGIVEYLQRVVSKIPDDLVRLQQQVETTLQKESLIQDMITGARSEIAELQKQVFGVRKALLALRYHACRHENEPPPSAVKLNNTLSISEQFNRLQQLAPHAYDLWHPLLTVNKVAYDGLSVDSCSVSGHPMATLFRFFLAPYLKGRVLDIGCGPQPVPTYLEDYPADAVYGIDPLSEPDEHPFHFVKCLAEYLPWEDSQFKLAVAATTLDHVLLLDQVLKETCRVLEEDGIFAVWVGFVPGSKHYDPYRQDIIKLDNYHLFHFDRDWFLDAIKPFFVILEEFSIDFENCFFAFRPKKPALL
jgi:SAM-dependent methyltransferase